MNNYDKLIKSFLSWNSKINLSAIRDEKGVKIKHIQDSLEGLKIIDQLNLKGKIDLVDIGSGSGFPILPLAIEKNNWNFIGIESVNKKVNALNSIIEELNLQNVKVIWTRAEDYKEKQFDILTARAVAYIDKLLKFSYHLVKKGGYFVLYKLDSQQEYKDILKTCKKYNLKLVKKYKYTLFEDDVQRVIYILKKN